MAITLTDDGTMNPADARKAELLAQYPDWRVTDPGKFEGEPIETIYFYELMLDGASDESIEIERDYYADIFAIDDEDRARWELRADTAYVMIETSEQGFVSLAELTDKEYARLQDESTDAAGPQDGDITTEDHRTFYQDGRVVLEPYCTQENGMSLWFGYERGKQFQIRTGPDDPVAAVRAYMDRVRYWPNCWFISDHGNAHRMDLSGK